MQKTILPKNITRIWDYFLVANAYLNKLNPRVGFMGGFNMMVMAGVFNNPPPKTEEKPEQELINLLEEVIPKIELELQTSISEFFSSDMHSMEMSYHMLPIYIDNESDLNRRLPTEYHPSLVFSDEVLTKVSKHYGNISASNFTIAHASRNKNDIALVFKDRKSLIRFVKDKDITIHAFGKKWKP